MRLICPKCDAQYNVADDAIPKGGRDVQCSTCGHTWFQTEMSRVLSRPVSRVLERPIPTAVKPEPVEPKISASRDVAAFDVPHQHKDKSQPHTPRHKPVDANIADILRQEAAREHNVPAKDMAETGTAPARERTPASEEDIEATRQRIAMMTEAAGGTRSGESPAAAAAVAAANPRSIPSLNEINGVLRSRSDHSATAEISEAERVEAIRRRGFRRGFFFVAGLFALAIAPYILAEQIIDNLPQSRETMTQYVAIVDQLRASMNVTITGIIESVQAIIARFSG